jgi:hypothetical protein
MKLRGARTHTSSFPTRNGTTADKNACLMWRRKVFAAIKFYICAKREREAAKP